MATLRDSYLTPSTGTSKIDSSNDRTAAIFAASASYSLSQVKLLVYRVGSPGTITVTVRATTTYGGVTQYYPTGADLLTPKTFDGDAVTASTDGEWVTITFVDTAALTSGTKYAIEVSAASADAANYLMVKHDAGIASWTGNYASSSNGGASYSVLGLYGINYEAYDNVSAINPSDKKYTRNIVTFCNDQVFYGPDPDSLVELAAASGDIDCSKPLRAAEAYGKVFIANHDKFRVADFVNVKITTADVGSNIPFNGDIIRGDTSSAAMVVDYITTTSGACTIYGNRISTETFEAETVTGTNKSGDSVSFTGTEEVAGPFWYEWTPYGNDTDSFGTMPTYASIVLLHIGRVWLMADTQYPHQWYGTRQNNPFDFLYAQNDAGSAVAGNNTDAGEVGDIIIDAISYSDDYMIFGCASELHVMLGNPCAGGRINLVRTSGLLAPRAWTWDNDKNLFLLTDEGLLKISQGFGAAQNVTAGVYPDFIEDLAYDPTIHRIAMAYDPVAKGIIISRVTISDGTNVCWFYDLRSGGMFPEVYPEEGSFFALWNFIADAPEDRALLIASQDGYIRKWDKTVKSDDAGASGNEAIDAYVGFGPIVTSNNTRRFGRLSGMNIVTGGDGDGGSNDSDVVYCKVFMEPSAEKLIKQMTSGAGPKYTRNFKVPSFKKGNVDRRKVRGRYAGFIIGNNTAAQSFAFEQVTANNI